MKRHISIFIWAVASLAVFTDFSFSENRDYTKKEFGGKKPAVKKNMGLEDLFGTLEGKEQKMDREKSSSASSIRGLNPIAEEYGQGQRDLSRYIGDVKAMEEQEISEQELRDFLKGEGLGPSQ